MTESAASAPAGGRPLDGVVVADLTRLHPGGYLTRILCDLGAEVLKIEPPGGSHMRAAGAGADYMWVTLHHSMRSMTIDLRHERAADALTALAPMLDVIVESHPLGRLETAGMGYSQLSEINPRLIWCSLTSWGLVGPYAERGGHEINFLAHSGVLDLITPDDAVPNQPPLMIAASQGAMWGAIGVLAALEQRHRTGRGQWVDTSITDATMWLTSQEVTRTAQGIEAWPGSSPGRTSYRCADGRWLTMASIEARTWRALALGLGLDDLADSVEGRPAPEADVRSRLATAIATRPASHWMAAIPEANLTITHAVDDLAGDVHVRARKSIVEIPNGDRSEVVTTLPVRFGPDDDPTEYTTPPPAPGEASDEVWERAGIDPAHLAALQASGVLG